MKKVLAVNGSPRKNWNTAMMLEKALEGTAEAGTDGCGVKEAGAKENAPNASP